MKTKVECENFSFVSDFRDRWFRSRVLSNIPTIFNTFLTYILVCPGSLNRASSDPSGTTSHLPPQPNAQKLSAVLLCLLMILTSNSRGTFFCQRLLRRGSFLILGANPIQNPRNHAHLRLFCFSTPFMDPGSCRR